MKQVLVLLLLIVMCSFVNAQDKEIEGTEAPNFALENLDGDIVELSELTGKGPVLLSFWATWCRPCVEELVHFNKMYENYKDKGFTLIGIATDSERSIAKVKPFIKTHGYEFEVLMDTNQEVSRMFYARAVPYTVLLDKNGKIIYSHLGYKKGDELKVESLIKDMLK